VKLLFVVQAYGADVYGGAETACRDFATRLAARGHEVEVVTTCARSYVDWANDFPAGTTQVDGVAVHRLPVSTPRDLDLFGPANGRAVYGRRPVPLYLQREWMDLQGPRVDGLPAWLAAEAHRFDAVSFFTYLYWTTWAGLPACDGRTYTILHPLAHDEAPFFLPLLDTTFHHADAFAFLTPEEHRLMSRRTAPRPSAITGLGVDLDPPVADVDPLRERLGLGDRPYLAAVGRVEEAKGQPELHEFFTAYKQRHPGDLALLIAGRVIDPLPAHRDVIVCGPLDEADKLAAMAGAVGLVQPSPFESFSIVLMEAWARRRPALVNGHSEVLLGHARRSGGAVPYFDFPSFEAALDRLLDDGDLRAQMGAAGRAYVEASATWDTVLDRYERLVRVRVRV
jgi:glycosyltransferase involved in cell wall biosynthesis